MKYTLYIFRLQHKHKFQCFNVYSSNLVFVIKLQNKYFHATDVQQPKHRNIKHKIHFYLTNVCSMVQTYTYINGKTVIPRNSNHGAEGIEYLQCKVIINYTEALSHKVNCIYLIVPFPQNSRTVFHNWNKNFLTGNICSCLEILLVPKTGARTIRVQRVETRVDDQLPVINRSAFYHMKLFSPKVISDNSEKLYLEHT